MWISIDLVKNGAVVGRIKTGDNSYYNMGTNIIIAHLNTGEDGDTKHVVSGGGYFTTFAEYLKRKQINRISEPIKILLL